MIRLSPALPLRYPTEFARFCRLRNIHPKPVYDCLRYESVYVSERWYRLCRFYVRLLDRLWFRKTLDKLSRHVQQVTEADIEVRKDPLDGRLQSIADDLEEVVKRYGDRKREAV